MPLPSLDELAAAPTGKPIDPRTLVAEANFAPRQWQATAPDDWSRKPAVTRTEDLRRVRDLPRRPRPDADRLEAMVELMTKRYRIGNGTCACATWNRKCITRLRPAQAWALFEIGLRGGLLGPIGVGHGKTILDILVPFALQSRLALLLVPAALVTQLIAEYELVSQHFRVPSLVVHGLDYVSVRAGEPVLHAMSYERMSRSDATDFLERHRYDAIVADEVHKLRHASATRTSRVLRYFAAHPETKFCGWSGSVTDKSLKDYAHLSALALREGSPLPLVPEVVEEWAAAIDPSDWPAPGGALLELCEPGEHVSSGFHRRLVETQGVVTTEQPAIDAELVIVERNAPEIPDAVAEHLDALRDTWCRPDGEELIDALSVARCARELACGFYYRWIFPRGEPVPLILDWLDARRDWHRELRYKLKQRAEYLDSPLLLSRAARRAWGDDPNENDLPEWKATHWPRWRDVRNEVRPEIQTVRVDDYLARDAAAWAAENRGIVWYESRALGEWVAEISGLPLHGGGAQARARIAAEQGDRSIVASIRSHGTGRDGLQFLFCEQLIAQPPSSSMAWEQLLGRLHRVGQESPVIRAEFYRHTVEMAAAVDQAMSRALYVESTIGAAQKIRVGWNSAAASIVVE